MPSMYPSALLELTPSLVALIEGNRTGPFVCLDLSPVS